MTSQTFKKGKILYFEGGINKRRHNKDKIYEGEIIRVGRKYLTVKIGCGEYKFNIENLRQVTQYSADYYLYLTKDEIIEKRERETIISDLRFLFSSHYGGRMSKISTEDLKKIHSIINKSEVK